MSTRPSPKLAFFATLAVAAAACAAPSGHVDRMEATGTSSAALDVGPESVPYPVQTINGTIQYDATGHAIPAWSGTVVDVMAADAWAQCGAHVTSAADTGQDSYLKYLETRMTQVPCPNVATQTLPASSFSIAACSTLSCPMKTWARQRQFQWCNTDTSTGSQAVVRFKDNSHVGHKLDPSLFASIGAPSADVRTAAISYAQKQIDVAEVNLCMAQRLRENVASADSLFLSAEDMRQLLEVIRERAQIAMTQYALLGRAFTNPDDRGGAGSGIVGPTQAFVLYLYWVKQSAAVTPLSEMGEDFAAAIDLHIDTTNELAELLVRSAAARIPRGGTPASNAQDDFGSASWRQRLLSLLYGGNPLRPALTNAEIDLSSIDGGIDALTAAFGTMKQEVPWDWQWTQDTLGTSPWPNQVFPLAPAQRYAVAPSGDPHVQQLLGLTRAADGFLLKERNADYTVPAGQGLAGGTLTFRKVDVDATAPVLWSVVEAQLRTAQCQKTTPTCKVAINDPSIPTPANYTQSLLWQKYRIDPSHAKALVAMLADVLPRQSETDFWKIAVTTAPSMLQEIQGGRHVTGASSTLSAADMTARLPGQTGTWYHLDPKFNALPLGLPEVSPLYTSYDPAFFVRSYDKFNVPANQGFEQSDKVKALGAMSALALTRDYIEDSLAGANATIKSGYLAKAQRSVTAITGAIGERSVSVHPTIYPKPLWTYCTDYYPNPTPSGYQACWELLQSSSTDGKTTGWDVSVRTEANDPFFAGGPVSLVVVPFAGGIESDAATDPSYSSFKGATRASLLEFPGHVEVALPAPAATATTAQVRTAHVDLPTVFALFPPPAGTLPSYSGGVAFSMFLKRTNAKNVTEYQLLAQHMTLTTMGGMEATDATNKALVFHPYDGQYFAYSGVLGKTATTAWATLAHDWSKPKYDGFGFSVDWVPPTDPSLFGANASDDAVSEYLRSAKTAADDATAAVKSAIDELLKEQADEAVLATAQLKASEISQLEQRALCGDANAKCDTSTYDFNLFFDPPSGDRYIPDASCTTGNLCLTNATLDTSAVPQTVRLARAVYDHRNDTAPPSFDEYAGGTLQKLLIEQWTALRKLRANVFDTGAGIVSHQAQIAAAQAELDHSTNVAKYECSDKAMTDAFNAGFGYTIDKDKGAGWELFVGPDNGYAPDIAEDKRTWSPGPFYAQQHSCESAKLTMPPDQAKVAAAVADGWAWESAQATQLLDAAGALQITTANFAKGLQDTNLAKAKAQLEASVAADTLMTKFGTYRRYHSYDVWRARALLESARRYAVTARRAIEARFVLDLSTMRGDEPFVAAPATWADEIYEYDLSAPTAVGLTAIPKLDNGIYPNRLSDYIGNLERLVQGYAIARPTADAHKDDDVFDIVGPDARVDAVLNGVAQKILAGKVAAWEFLCPGATAWVQHPGLTAATPNAPITALCSGAQPTRARVSFWLDPWGRRGGDVADEPYAKRYNARWYELAVNLVGTEVRDCTKSPDPNGCYAQSFLRYDLSQTGVSWVTSFEEQWRALGDSDARIEGAKALAAEQWLDPIGNGFAKPYVDAVVRTELLGRPMGGTYRIELEITPDVRLDHIDRVQVLTRSDYWVKQR